MRGPYLYVLENLAYAVPGLDMMFDKGETSGAMHDEGFAAVEN